MDVGPGLIVLKGLLIKVNKMIFRELSTLLLYYEQVEKYPGAYADGQQHGSVAGSTVVLAPEFV